MLLADKTESAQLDIDAYLAELVKEESNKQTLGIVVVDVEMAALSTKDGIFTKSSELESDEKEMGSVRLHGLGDV
jgi:methyl coenzyme M reductase beta subunit